jgi:Mg2+/Co2+ transporter CorC
MKQSLNTEHEKQLYLSTSPDILEEEGETSAEAVVVPENTRIKTFLKNIRSNKNSKRNTSIDSIQRELWALKKEKYQKQIEVLKIIRKKELEDLKGKELDKLLKTKQLNSL